MKLHGRCVKNLINIANETVEADDEGKSFRDNLEKCYLELCRKLNIPVPLWMKKNTKELGAFHKTTFPQEQFLESVGFDFFEIKIEK